MKNLDKQQLVIFGLGLLIILGFGIFQYIPLVRHNNAMNEQIDQTIQLNDQICMQSALLPELKHQEVQLEKELMEFSNNIPQGRNFALLWQQIADVMNECNLTEQLVQPGEELKSGQLCSIPLTLECQGTLEQLFAFFRAIEEMERLVRIEQVEFENDSSFDGIVKLNAKANVYYQPESNNNS